MSHKQQRWHVTPTKVLHRPAPSGELPTGDPEQPEAPTMELPCIYEECLNLVRVTPSYHARANRLHLPWAICAACAAAMAGVKDEGKAA